ncbi:hypothetical protein HK100_008619, partial [Physocladia obscura]
MELNPTKYPALGFDNSSLNWFGSLAGKAGALLEVTMQPLGGLSVLTATHYANLATGLLQVNEKYGVPVYLRYGHEMNGNWCPYCYEPTEYVASFRAMAQAVRAVTNMTAMVWAPNVGIHYPFGSTDSTVAVPAAGTADFTAMDTNGNGAVDPDDDPYTPYYPGDDVVDWTGLSLYYYPLSGCYNCPVPATYFNDYLTGKGPVIGFNDSAFSAVHNFYGMFSNDGTHNKPMMLPETAAPYFYGMPVYANSTTEIAIKQGWWSQLLGSTTKTNFPKFRAAIAFEQESYTTPFDVTYLTEYSITNSSSVLAMFINLIDA